MSIIKVENLSAAYGKKEVLTNISLEAEPGEIVGILGENGCGKSTLIKSICNILPHKGKCISDGLYFEKLSPRRLATFCSYVPQKSGLEIELPVLEVVLMGFNPKIRLLDKPNASMVEKATNILKSIGFEDRIHENFINLSEGQKQICIIARALITDSRMVLMDEPENALDVGMRTRMMSMVRQWVDKDERAAVMALHDVELALNYCDKLFLIKDGKCIGRIEPKNDTMQYMEESLTKIYGNICLRNVEDDLGVKHLVMLKEKL